MSSSNSLDAIGVTFDDERLVADAELIQPATLAQHLGLRGLFDVHVDLGDARGRANVGDKAMTLIHSVTDVEASSGTFAPRRDPTSSA